VHHPLADGSCQVLFTVRARCADEGDDDDGRHGEVKNGNFVETKGGTEQVGHPRRHFL
jgi:hypothetical protein